MNIHQAVNDIRTFLQQAQSVSEAVLATPVSKVLADLPK
jgi:hypothetical protein